MRSVLFVLVLMAVVLKVKAAPLSYQGQLQDQGQPFNGTADMEFQLFASLSGNDPVGDMISKEDVAVSDGVFQVELEFDVAFDDQPRYLSIVVQGQTLSPRQKITGVPVAQYALSSAGGSVWAPLLRGIEYEIDGLKLSFSATDSSPMIALGHSANQVVPGGTVSGGGTAAEPNEAASNDATIGGGRGNVAGVASTIGGGVSNFARLIGTVGGGAENSARGSGSTIAGGLDNRTDTDAARSAIGGGEGNIATGGFSVIGGGEDNQTEGDHATVGGGLVNVGSGQYSTVAGGFNHMASGLAATVGGGFSNAATALAATTPGGRDNVASGVYSFAAGRRAKANSSGVFVWADSTDEDFTSTNSDQFLIRATGGAVISGGTGAANDPGNAQLYVDGLTRVRHLEFDMLVPDSGDPLCITPAARVVVCGSSGRLKDEIAPLEKASDLVEQLRPVRYRWKSTGQFDIGLIAEDVAEVVPEIVRFDQSGQAETLRYSRIAAILVAAFQDLTQTQEQRFRALEAEGRQLRAQVARLVEENRRLERLARRNSELEDRLAHVESLLARDSVEMVRTGK